MRTKDTVYVMVRLDGGKIIRASWAGGAYVELKFGALPRATEVINVWDGKAGKASIDFDHPKVEALLKAEVESWAASHAEEGWSTWYEDYLENGRF